MKADDTISAWSTNKPLAIVSAADTTFLRRRGYGCNPHRSKLQNRTKFTPKQLPEESRNLKRFPTVSRWT